MLKKEGFAGESSSGPEFKSLLAHQNNTLASSGIVDI